METTLKLFRTPAALLMAFAVTCALFLLMRSLIDVTQQAIEARPSITIDIVKPRKLEPPVNNRRRPVEPPSPEAVPPTPPRVLVSVGSTSIALTPALTPPDAPTKLDGTIPDGPTLPLVRFQPVYPRQALARGIEGFAIVEFDVAPDGSVHNPQIIDHSPSSIFDAASLSAITKFRYKPRVENGVPVTVSGVRNRFTFELDQPVR